MSQITVDSGEAYSITVVPTPAHQIEIKRLGVQGVKGDVGATGPANTLDIGTVVGGAEADATITGTAPNQTLSLTLPKGDKGDVGDAGVDGTDGTDGVDGASAYEVAVAEGFEGTEQAWLASLVGPTGAAGADGIDGTNGSDGIDGADGDSAYEVAVAEGFGGTEAQWLASLVGPQGAAATIAVRTVTTVDPTDPATVTNVGTSGAAVFDFEIPKGDPGDGAGDMLASTYDPQGVAGDAFARANHTGTQLVRTPPGDCGPAGER